jgi:hypothetical protein
MKLWKFYYRQATEVGLEAYTEKIRFNLMFQHYNAKQTVI